MMSLSVKKVTQESPNLALNHTITENPQIHED